MVEPIKSLVPLEVKLHQHSAKVSSIKATWEDTEEVQVTEKQQKLDGNSSPMNIPTVERQQKILSKIDLSGLTFKQREMVRNVIRKEWEVFQREMMMWEKTESIQWKSTWKTATKRNLITMQYHETYIMN